MTEWTIEQAFETVMASTKTDSKGRLIGYIIGMNDNGVEFAAWVQNARKVNGKWVAFGATQRSKRFESQAKATVWAYLTARDRVEKL